MQAQATAQPMARPVPIRYLAQSLAQVEATELQAIQQTEAAVALVVEVQAHLVQVGLAVLGQLCKDLTAVREHL